MSTRLFDRFFDEVDAPSAMRRFILAELSSPTRHWHGMMHHALMLRRIDKTGHSRTDRRLLILAVLFHDIVYDATRSDNEEASASVARDWLAGDEADVVAELIRATKAYDLAAADPVTRSLLDADLSVLWTPSVALYRYYAEGIRAEYGHVPDDAFYAGRAAVLRRLEQRIRPFLTPADSRLLARNLGSEIVRLSPPALP